MSSRTHPRTAVLAVATILLLAACGGSSDDEGADGTTSVVASAATSAASPAATTSAAASTTVPASPGASTSAVAPTTVPASTTVVAPTTVPTLAAVPGFDPEARTITVGSLVPTTGNFAFSAPYAAGLETYFRWRNAKAPVGGDYEVKVIVEDSQYNPQVALTAYGKLKDQVVMFGQIHGTPIVNALLPQLNTDGTSAIATTYDLPWVREASLLPQTTPFQLQVANVVTYATEQLGLTDQPVCALVQADSLGQSHVEGLAQVSGALGLSVGEKAEFAPNADNLVGQVQQLKDASCTVVLFAGGPNLLALAGSAAAQLDFTPQWLATQASGNVQVTKGPLADSYFKPRVVFASQGTAWGDTSVPGQADLLAAVAEFAPDTRPDGQFSAGFASGALVAQVLERALAAGDLSRDGIRATIAEAGTLTTGGLTPDQETGPIATRRTPITSTIYGIDTSTPLGLAPLAMRYASPAAESYPLPGS